MSAAVRGECFFSLHNRKRLFYAKLETACGLGGLLSCQDIANLSLDHLVRLLLIGLLRSCTQLKIAQNEKHRHTDTRSAVVTDDVSHATSCTHVVAVAVVVARLAARRTL